MSFKFPEDLVLLTSLKVNPDRVVSNATEAHRCVLFTSRVHAGLSPNRLFAEAIHFSFGEPVLETRLLARLQQLDSVLHHVPGTD